LTWDDVIRLASDLPGVTVSTSYGTPALKVGGKLLTRLLPEDDRLVLPDVPVDERALLIELNPRIFHVTPHYEGYPIVLASLAAVEPEVVRAFLERRWRNIAPKRAISRRDAGRPDSRRPDGSSPAS